MTIKINLQNFHCNFFHPQKLLEKLIFPYYYVQELVKTDRYGNWWVHPSETMSLFTITKTHIDNHLLSICLLLKKAKNYFFNFQTKRDEWLFEILSKYSSTTKFHLYFLYIEKHRNTMLNSYRIQSKIWIIISLVVK